MDKLTFGIVIPNLNQTKYIETALESLRYQNCYINVAVMDGGSNDNIESIVNDYKDVIQYYSSKKDKGQSAAIKEGWKRVDGEIIAWLNADDYYYPFILDKVAAYFNCRPDIDVVYGDAIHVTEDGSFRGYFPAIKPFDRKKIGSDNFICQPACFMRKKAYMKVEGINPKLNYTMDWDLWCQLSKAGAKFHYLKSPIAAVRYYEGTKTLTRSYKRYLEIIRIEQKYGRRVIPISVFGADYYGLFTKKKLTKSQKTYMLFYGFLRNIKNKIMKNNSSSDGSYNIYGSDRWGQNIDNKFYIHLPWYHNVQQWDQILLNLFPKEEEYDIRINGIRLEEGLKRRKKNYIRLKKEYAPHIQIEIASKNRKNWHFISLKTK